MSRFINYICSMKNLLFLFATLFAISSFAQKPNPSYDSTLAKKYGADDYGMKKYVLVILKTGSNTTTDKKFIDEMFKGHMDNMEVLVKNNQLIIAGPISKNDKTYRGIFILNVSTKEEAEKILETDPAVKSKLLEAEIYNWYGSAALPSYLDFSEKVGKYQF